MKLMTSFLSVLLLSAVMASTPLRAECGSTCPKSGEGCKKEKPCPQGDCKDPSSCPKK